MLDASRTTWFEAEPAEQTVERVTRCLDVEWRHAATFTRTSSTQDVDP